MPSFWSEKLEKVQSRFTYKAVATNSTAPDQQWNPITLKLPFLAILFLVTVAIIAALEYFHYNSKGYNAGGLAFGAPTDDISPTITFLFSYMPTLIAVVYAMIWSC